MRREPNERQTRLIQGEALHLGGLARTSPFDWYDVVCLAEVSKEPRIVEAVSLIHGLADGLGWDTVRLIEHCLQSFSNPLVSP